ncbi:MAG: hypothetical protein CXR31_12670 [Geobacter sp.]|nr:MAG: hypothetical protein CXR31_12670 [Geobacter sp.]
MGTAECVKGTAEGLAFSIGDKVRFFGSATGDKCNIPVGTVCEIATVMENHVYPYGFVDWDDFAREDELKLAED